MKIAVNVRLLEKDHLTGIGVFTVETMKRLAAMHPEHTFYFIFDQKPDSDFITSENIIPCVTGIKSRHRAVLLKLWFEYILPPLLRRIKPDLFISPDGFMSLRTDVPTLIVIHDINFEHFPQHLPRSITAFYRKYTPRYVEKARRVVTVSEYSKKDIADTYGVSSQKIDVVYNGADSCFCPTNEEVKKEIREKYTCGEPYFLFVGTIHPRKNLANQLRAFDLFMQNPDVLPHRFLIVGERWIWDKALQETYDSMKYRNHVVFVGRLPFDELGRVYSAATALMYVSLFEGFGIPIIEGFYSGTAVITSTSSSMPEVGGDAAVYVSPDNPEEIAIAMYNIASDDTYRKMLIQKGHIRKQLFTWDRTAELFSESIKKLQSEI